MWPFKSNSSKKEIEVKSTHRVEVVPVVLEPHPNADTLSIVKVYGYQVVVKTVDWEGVDKAAYIQPDSLVPDKPEYTFLGHRNANGSYDQLRDKDRRITARRFRGVRSEGLLMPAPPYSKIGDNVAEEMGIERYISAKEKKEQEDAIYAANWWQRLNRKGRRGLSNSENERGPSIWVPVYDLENWYRYPSMFTDGEPVYITEKIHGANARYVYSSLDGRFFVGSRALWKRPKIENTKPGGLVQAILIKLGLQDRTYKDAQDDWNGVARQYKGIEEFCKVYPDHILFGEVYGDVQDLKYGHKQGELSFAAFDVFNMGVYWDAELFESTMHQYDIPTVPVLASRVPYSENIVRELVDGSTKTGYDPKQIREGIVIRPMLEEWNTERRMPGRKILKAVSSAYLERAGK